MDASKTRTPTKTAPRYVMPTELQGAEFKRTEYRFTPQKSVAIDDLLRPDAWAHVASTLRIGDTIEAVPEDSSWYLKLLVRHIEAPEVHVGVISMTKFEPVAQRAAA